MQALRQAAFLARLVLAWFVVSLGVAIASPVVKPQSIELICSGAGAVKLVGQGDDAGKPAGSHTLDCPLCASLAGPPAVAQSAAQAAPQGHVLQSIPAARTAAPTAAPPPGRGPPPSRSV